MNNRRKFLGSAVAAGTYGIASSALGARTDRLQVQVELPRARVPLSFIIDDSTCLVNMGRFCMPQFAATYPEREIYQRPWQQWPAEIPDRFVRDFIQWCGEHGVKGKYSVVPNPACVGWLDRTLPGWSQRALDESLKLVREEIVPNWDIHPEMITHTRVIDLKTGRPFADYSPASMENSYPGQDVSVDYLASYLAYALQILHNCDLPCEGITTPGGFGNRVKEKLPQAVFQAVRDVYGTELPHYFKYIAGGENSTEPKLESGDGRELSPKHTVANVLAGTGDWFGGWDGAETSRGEKYATPDASGGRMVELIERRQPAVMLCHWPGMYCNGTLAGYHDFQRVVQAIEGRFHETTLWMKLSEIGRYWAAKAWTELGVGARGIEIDAPWACPRFTLKTDQPLTTAALIREEGTRVEMKRVRSLAALDTDTLWNSQSSSYLCFDLTAGKHRLEINVEGPREARPRT